MGADIQPFALVRLLQGSFCISLQAQGIDSHNSVRQPISGTKVTTCRFSGQSPAPVESTAVILIASRCPVPQYAASAGLLNASLDSCRPGLSGGRPREAWRGDLFITDAHFLWGLYCILHGDFTFKDVKDINPLAGAAIMCPWGLEVSACLPKCPISFLGAAEVLQRDEANKPLPLFICHFSLAQVLQDSFPTGSQSQHMSLCCTLRWYIVLHWG